MAEGPNETYATVGQVHVWVTWPTFNFCDPLHTLGTAVITESNVCSVCGAFNAAFTELLWPLVAYCHLYFGVIVISYWCYYLMQAGFSALHLAAQNGHNESARILLFAGCSPDHKNGVCFAHFHFYFYNVLNLWKSGNWQSIKDTSGH